jgi:flagellar hook-basal body complex protein FliE
MLTAMTQIANLAASGIETPRGDFATASGVYGLPGKIAEGAAPFADLLGNAIGEVGRLEGEAQKAVTGLMTGSGVDVHQAIIATEKASMAFEMSLAVRNKAIQAYQTVMGMQF